MTEKANERFERMAELFEQETGYMAPGKSAPPEMGYTIMQDAERSAHWKTFCAGYLSGEAVAREVTRAQPDSDQGERP